MSSSRSSLPDHFFKLQNHIKKFPCQSARRKTHPSAQKFEENQLNELLNQIKVSDDPFDPDDYGKKVIRFVLDNQGKLRFGKEGAPNQTTPSHGQLSTIQGSTEKDEAVFAAGNLYFNDKNELAMITHKSGDYKTDFHSLLLAMIAFYKLQAKYPDQEIKFHNEIKVQQTIMGGIHDKYEDMYVTKEHMLGKLAEVSQHFDLAALAPSTASLATNVDIDPYASPKKRSKPSYLSPASSESKPHSDSNTNELAERANESPETTPQRLRNQYLFRNPSAQPQQNNTEPNSSPPHNLKRKLNF